MIPLIGIVLGLTFNAEIVMKSYSQPTPTPVPTPSPGSQGLVSPQAQQQQQRQQQGFEQTFQELHKQEQILEQRIQQEQQRSPPSQELQSLQQRLQELRQQLEQLQQVQSPQAIPAKEEGHLPPLAPTQEQQQNQQIQQQQQQLQQVLEQVQQFFQRQAQQQPQPQQQQQSPTVTPQMAKFKVNIDSIKIHSDHDPFASGEWRMFFTSNAQQIRVDTPNGAMWDVDNGETVVFRNLFLNVAIPTTNGVLFIDTLGEEVDGQETKIPAIPAAVRVAFVAGAIITGNPLAATYTGYLDKARSVLQTIVALDKNDGLGIISKEYRQADNYGIGVHSDVSSTRDYTLTYTISRIP
jgi:chemotaxis protein histidine kinase CheA